MIRASKCEPADDVHDNDDDDMNKRTGRIFGDDGITEFVYFYFDIDGMMPTSHDL